MKMNKVNIVRLKGGLGNQLFIYAFFLSLSKNASYKCYLDFSHYRYHKSSSYIELENAFDIRIMSYEAPVNLVRKLSNRDYELFFKFYKRIFGSKKSHYFDLEQGYDSKVYMLNNHYFDGYWQSFRYFDNFRDELIEHLKFKTLTDDPNLIFWSDKIKSSKNSVSLHVRGTDYLNDNIYKNLSNSNYYKDALEILDMRVKNVFLFTDDKDFVKNNRYFDEFIIVDTSRHANHLDMYLMSLCEYNIIANSTYSWWSAYLNTNQRKIVIAPSEWFNNRCIHLSDLYPENWITVKVK